MQNSDLVLLSDHLLEIQKQ